VNRDSVPKEQFAQTAILTLAHPRRASLGEEHMDKKIAGLLGAAAALVTVGSVQAAALDSTAGDAATTYRDLLNPVPNAVEALKSDDASRASAPGTEKLEVAQVIIGVGHHHHHARARVRIVPPVHRHHHHHHHNTYYGR
jgi:hypothetical protein